MPPTPRLPQNPQAGLPPLPLPSWSLTSLAANPAVPARPPFPQFVNTRQLSPTVSGEYSWVVGPEEAAGMSLGLTRRTEKLMLMGRLEVGGCLHACMLFSVLASGACQL